MVFNSVVFLFCFLPLSLLLYYLVPGRAKNAVLLAESLAFYCWTGIEFLPLIAVLIVFNYLCALVTVIVSGNMVLDILASVWMALQSICLPARLRCW